MKAIYTLALAGLALLGANTTNLEAYDTSLERLYFQRQKEVWNSLFPIVHPFWETPGIRKTGEPKPIHKEVEYFESWRRSDY